MTHLHHPPPHSLCFTLVKSSLPSPLFPPFFPPFQLGFSVGCVSQSRKEIDFSYEVLLFFFVCCDASVRIVSVFLFFFAKASEIIKRRGESGGRDIA